MPNEDYARISRRLHRIEQNLSGLSTPQLIHSSIEDGSIDEYDEAGSLVGVVGKQFDGTHGAVAFQGPTPPAPSTPAATGGPGTLSVSWNGIFAGGMARPLDLHFVRATARRLSPDEGAPFTVGTLVASGSVVAAVPAGVYEVTLSAESMPGLTSAPSLPASATVTVPADQQALQQEIADANTRLDEARAELEEEIGTAPVALDRLQTATTIPDAVISKLFGDVVVARTKVVSEAFIGGEAIITGAITAPKITASEELTAKIGQFLKVKADQIEANAVTAAALAANAINGKLITGAVFQTRPGITEGLKLIGDGTSNNLLENNAFVAYGENGALTVRINGTDNLITGRFYTNTPEAPGIVMIPKTSTGQPGIFFSEDGSASGAQPAIYTDSSWALTLRGKSGSTGAGPIRIIGGANIVSGGIGGGDGGANNWLIDSGGAASFQSVYGNKVYGMLGGLLGKQELSDRHVEFVQNVAGLYFRTSGGSAPSGADATVYAADNDSPLYFRSPANSAGVRTGFRFLAGPLEYYDPPTSTFGANVGISTSPKDRIYKLTSNAKYKVDIRPITLDTAKKLLDVEPVTWFDRAQAEAYADHLAGEGPGLENIMPLRRIPGFTAQNVEAAGLEEFVTRDADDHLEGVTYDRFSAPILLLVKDLYREIELLKEAR